MPKDCCPMGYHCLLMTGYSFEFCINRKVCQNVALTINCTEGSNDVPNPLDWDAIDAEPTRDRPAERLYQRGDRPGSATIHLLANSEECARV